MVLSRFWIYMANIYAELDNMDHEQLQDISQEAIQSYLKYEVGDILDEIECQPFEIIKDLSYYQ